MLLTPSVNNNPLQESLKKLGAQQKQIDAWILAVNKYHKNKPMLINEHEQLENCLQENCLQENCLHENCSQENCLQENCLQENCSQQNCSQQNCSQRMLQNELSQEDCSTDLPVPPNNWNAVRLFMLLATQWRVSDAKPIGIDYSAIEPTARLAEIKLSQLIFEKIRLMEQTTLEIYAELTTAS